MLSYCKVTYAGYGNHGMVYLYDACPTLSHCTFQHSSHAAVFVSGKGSSKAQIRCNRFADNDFGIYCTYQAAPAIQRNNFSGNRSYGLYNSGEATLKVVRNWWGDPQGPDTGGDKVNGNVVVKPWSLKENRCDDKRANCRSCPPSDEGDTLPESMETQRAPASPGV